MTDTFAIARHTRLTRSSLAPKKRPQNHFSTMLSSRELETIVGKKQFRVEKRTGAGQNLQGKRKEIERWWTLAARNVWAYPFVISCANRTEPTLSPWLFVIGVYIMDGPFYPRQLTPPNPPSPPPFDLRQDLHYKYVPTGMHVRQYDGSLFPFLSPILLSVPPILTSPLCLSIVLRYRE